MKHLTDAQLRTHLDGELSADEISHLQNCSECQLQLAAVSARAGRIASSMAGLAPTGRELPPSSQVAFSRFHNKYRKEQFLMQSLFPKRFRPAFAAVAIILALGIALTFAPVQALATNFLGLFRVNQIEVVEVDVSNFQALNNDSALGERIGELFSDSFTVTKEPGDPVAVAGAAAASDAAGFTVRLPSGQTASSLTVQDGTAFEFTINRPQAQAILDDAGFDLQLPESIDGKPVTVTVPSAVSAAYGTCPQLDGEAAEPEGFRNFTDCVVFTQVPSPTIDAPAELDVKALAEVGLQFMGMNPDEAQQLSDTVDWTTTLVIPIPRNAAEVKDVSVDGVTGTLLTRFSDDGDPAHYTLIWVKDGIIYAITGFDSAEGALEMANSLQ
jgi:hypothetical protein